MLHPRLRSFGRQATSLWSRTGPSRKKLKDLKDSYQGAVHSHKKGKTTEVEKAAYSASLETMTFNIASPAWREVESDIILTEEETREKI